MFSSLKFVKRYELIKDYFSESLTFKDEKLIFNGKNIKLIDQSIPNFINNDLDDLTEKMSEFYNEVQFPNYDDCEDYASLYDKGVSNLFTKRLDDELGFGSRILELGCGTGQLSLFLSRLNRQIFAVDISNASLKLGEKFRKKYKLDNTFFMKMDVFNLKFKNNTFDSVVTNGVLHHTKDAEEAFKCLVKVLKPGGVIVVGLYHKYGRTVTRIKQNLAKIIGSKIFYFDKTSRNIKSKDKRKAWVQDQFMNPHETLHTPNEVLNWFEESNVEFHNLIPYYSIHKNKLLRKNKKPSISIIDDLLLSVNPVQIKEGGFFVMVGRKRK